MLDAAARQVVRNGQTLAAGALGRGEQDVREQRQRSGVVGGGTGTARLEVGQQERYQTVVDLDGGLPGGSGDRLAQFAGRHRTYDDLPAAQGGGEERMGKRLGVEVGPQGEDDQHPAPRAGVRGGQRREGEEKRAALLLVGAEGEDLLQLVHRDGQGRLAEAGHFLGDGFRPLAQQVRVERRAAGGLRDPVGQSRQRPVARRAGEQRPRECGQKARVQQ